jgi:hypothetical protein
VPCVQTICRQESVAPDGGAAAGSGGEGWFRLQRAGVAEELCLSLSARAKLVGQLEWNGTPRAGEAQLLQDEAVAVGASFPSAAAAAAAAVAAPASVGGGAGAAAPSWYFELVQEQLREAAARAQDMA